jgi:hypothetical protein
MGRFAEIAIAFVFFCLGILILIAGLSVLHKTWGWP